MFLLFTLACHVSIYVSCHLTYYTRGFHFVKRKFFLGRTDDESGAGRVSLSTKTCGQRKKELTANFD